MTIDPIFLASYPRSGNTLLRTILFHCFGLRSGSVYPNDLGGNARLEQYVGHLERDKNGNIPFGIQTVALVKTHERPKGPEKAIYVVRDGRAASVSLWEFYDRKNSLSNVISGQHRFGTWSDHIRRWRPWERPNTLFVRYEEILSDMPKLLRVFSEFIEVEPISDRIPDRNTIASVDGRWVRKKSRWDEVSTPEHMKLFDQFNAIMMRNLRYYTDEDMANWRSSETIQPVNLENRGFSTDYMGSSAETRHAPAGQAKDTSIATED